MKDDYNTANAAPTDEDKGAPDSWRRIKNVEKAREQFKRHWDDGSARRKQMQTTRNQLEGGRPFDPAVLRKMGLSWMTNVNFRDAEAAFNRTYLPYWKMVNDVPNKIAVTVDSRSPHSDKWGKAFQECFDLFLKDWGCGYFFNFMLLTQDYVKFGPAFCTWADGDDPRYQHARVENAVLPKKAVADPDKWEIFSLKRDMSVSELWEKVHTDKAAEQSHLAGWNKQAVRDAIRLAKGGGDRLDDSDWTKIQDEITGNDIALSDDWAPLPVVYTFVKSLDGKISCLVYTECDKVKEFLCELPGYADTFREVVGAIFYDVGVGGQIATIKGFSIKNYDLSVLTNRMKSRVVDAASIAMALNFTRTTDTPDESPPVEAYGAVNIFPRGLNQLNIYPQLEQGRAAVEMLQMNAAENNGIYRDASRQIAETETAKQAMILANLSEEIGEATASIYLAQIGERIFAEQFRRLRKRGNTHPAAKKFVARLRARGVPLKAIHDSEVTVATGANPGTAGAALRDMVFKELLSLSRMPGVNQRWVLEQYLANKLGTQAVSKALLPEGTDSNPASRRLAMLENAHFGQGMELPVDPADAHFEHCEEHLKPLESVAQGYAQTQQMPSPEHITLLMVAIPHVDAHFELLKADETMKEEYKQIWPRYSQVRSMADGIFTKLRKQEQGLPVS